MRTGPAERGGARARTGASAPAHAQVGAAGPGAGDEKQKGEEEEEEEKQKEEKGKADWRKGPGRHPRVNLGAIGSPLFAGLMDRVMEFCYEADERLAETDKPKGPVKTGAPIARVR